MKLYSLTKENIEGAILVSLYSLEYEPKIEVYRLNDSFKVIIHPVAAITDNDAKFADTFEFCILFSETIEKLINYIQDALDYCSIIEVEDNATKKER